MKTVLHYLRSRRLLYPLRMRPLNDMHVHLRRKSDLFTLATRASAAHAATLLVMPNTDPAILTWRDAMEYCEEILAECDPTHPPQLVMALKMTQDMTPDRITEIPHDLPFQIVVKLYPTTEPDTVIEGPTSLHTLLWLGRGSVTTNAHGGVFNIRAPNIVATLKEMEKRRIRLCLHAAEAGAPNQQAEELFLAEHLPWLQQEFPNLRIVIEHLSTKFGVDLVRTSGPNVTATITLHHLLLTHEDVVGGRVQPHHHCMPTPNRYEDMMALLGAAMSGDPKFCLGSDTAPHVVGTKECSSGCAGVFTAPVLAAGLAQLFVEHGCEDKLDFFASGAAERIYDLSPSPLPYQLHLEPEPQVVLERHTYGAASVVSLFAGKELGYSVYLA